MKNRFFTFLSLAVIALGGFGHAQVFQSLMLNNHAEAKIPWKFYMGDKLMPAGDYHFDIGATEHVIFVHTWDAKYIASAATDSSKPMAAGEQALVVFDKIGEQYFLHQVSDDATKLNFILPPSDREKSLSKEKAK